MYRTDKQFMKNPATAASRIYVGSLNKSVIAEDLEKVFSAHGKILGMSLNSGFAFIQYEHEGEAQDAIQNENGSMLAGRKIIVRPSFGGNQPNQRGGANQGPQRGGGNQRGGMSNTTPSRPNQPPQLSPQRQEPTPGPKPLLATPVSHPADSQKSQPPPIRNEEMPDDIMDEDRPNIRPPGPPKHSDRGRRGRNQGPPSRPRGRSNDRDRFSGRFEPPQDPYMDPYRRDESDFMPPMRNDPYAPPPIIESAPVIEKNDCEIIVVSKALTEYAEYIENKLKHLGLIVDLLFPNEDVPIGKVLANISSRGCLYAIMVMPINEEHRSLTLNVLHGAPQEHRNMPVEDAMLLISRNFEAYMKGEQMAPDPSALSLLDRHPVPIQMLLNLLAENRQLTSILYDKIIKYLQEKRDLQHDFEIAEGITPDLQDDNSNSKETELQNRIMNILNKTTDSPIPTSITAPEPPAKSEAPILKDPTVQKALDSLMLGDMFKNIAGGV